MHHQLPFTALLNKLFGPAVTALLGFLGIHPHNPEAPITNFVAMEILAALILLLLFVLLRMRLSVDAPGVLQHMFEGVRSFLHSLTQEIVGPHSERYVPFLAVLGLFILTANLIGVVPSFESPTANPAVPLGCAVASFSYYNWQGIRHHGLLSYLKHFMGPMPALAILMVPIEVISHMARMLSLTIRLFANIFAGDLVLLVFFSLVPLVIPVIFLGLHIGVAFLQTYIFILLSTVYLAGAVAEEH
jgi:F-type H+-transporting ATPase subunit a